MVSGLGFRFQRRLEYPNSFSHALADMYQAAEPRAHRLVGGSIGEASTLGVFALTQSPRRLDQFLFSRVSVLLWLELGGGVNF